MSYRGLGQWAELIAGIIGVGAQAYAADVSKDVAESQLELAKINAKSELDRAKAAALLTQIKAQSTSSEGSMFSSTTIGIGTLALLAGGGALAYMLLKKRGRR